MNTPILTIVEIDANSPRDLVLGILNNRELTGFPALVTFKNEGNSASFLCLDQETFNGFMMAVQVLGQLKYYAADNDQPA